MRVRLSVRLSHAGILSKRLYLETRLPLLSRSRYSFTLTISEYRHNRHNFNERLVRDIAHLIVITQQPVVLLSYEGCVVTAVSSCAVVNDDGVEVVSGLQITTSVSHVAVCMFPSVTVVEYIILLMSFVQTYIPYAGLQCNVANEML